MTPRALSLPFLSTLLVTALLFVSPVLPQAEAEEGGCAGEAQGPRPGLCGMNELIATSARQTAEKMEEMEREHLCPHESFTKTGECNFNPEELLELQLIAEKAARFSKLGATTTSLFNHAFNETIEHLEQ